MDEQLQEQPELLQEQTEVVQENTVATEANTVATVKASSNGYGISKLTAGICALVVIATCYLATINKDFATQQASSILIGVTSGVFGIAVGKRT